MLRCFRAYFLRFQAPKHVKISFRTLRRLPRNEVGPRILQGKVKTVFDGDFSDHHERPSCGGYAKEFLDKRSGDILDMEDDFDEEAKYDSALHNSEQFYAMNEREEKFQKRKIKKSLIGRKYFKLYKETNLLTHAAKQQIHHLHHMNPTEWIPETIAKHFPISVNGAKKLLSSRFCLMSPEKIKQHDDDVARRWSILKSGRYSPEIYPATLQLWKEGKLSQSNYNGNHRLPTAPATSPKVIEKRAVHSGEYSSIVQRYVAYKQRTSKNYEPNTSENQLSHVDRTASFRNKESRYLKKLRYAAEEFEDDKPKPSKANSEDEIAVQHSQFRENQLQTQLRKRESDVESEYQKWVKQQAEETDYSTRAQKPFDEEYFSPIQKFARPNKDRTVNRSHASSREYVEEEICIPKKYFKKGLLFKKGNCVYDKDGKILFKLPT